ncbi:MAG: quercetin 2,3-dioxygenase [Streptosporangiaceae bacterium]|jgi:quercetin 2,3-dioxygenase
MTLEFARRREGSLLPGRPEPFFLAEGEGEGAVLIDSLFTVLLSADETDGQFGVFTMDAPAGDLIPPHSHGTHHEIFYVVRGGVTVFLDEADGTRRTRELAPGEFGYVPAGITHAYRVDADDTRVLGVCSGGFERFFATLGEPTDERHYPAVAHPLPPGERFAAAGQLFDTRFLPPERPAP